MLYFTLIATFIYLAIDIIIPIAVYQRFQCYPLIRFDMHLSMLVTQLTVSKYKGVIDVVGAMI